MEMVGKDRPPMLDPGIDNDIYSIIDACPNSMEMWKAVERLKQCESINVQDPKTNLYWEFEKFTSLDGESLNSYYLRFVTLVKQREQLKTISYHKLYDILKQHQNEVNEIRAERQERTTNPLTLISQQKLVYYPQPNTTHYTQSSSTRSQAATKNRDKAITNSPPLTYDPGPYVVDMMMASLKEKEIDKLVALISMSFKKIYKPTSNNLISSSNTRNTNVDNTPRSNRQTGRYDNQRAVNVVGARENVGTQVVQQTGIQCYNCKEFGHVSKECKKPQKGTGITLITKKRCFCVGVVTTLVGSRNNKPISSGMASIEWKYDQEISWYQGLLGSKESQRRIFIGCTEAKTAAL
ncbi:copia protein [Tanacetum coccineum]|uniref:Copia protein n=1 Tax=Tanacetum coccineum TaxID=301880 RepID=A0ABQ4WLW4_9ASTR